jgi:hypothetical protein
VALTNQLVQPAGIGCSVGEVARTAQLEGLVDGLLEAIMRLLNVSVFVGFASVIR